MPAYAGIHDFLAARTADLDDCGAWRIKSAIVPGRRSLPLSKCRDEGGALHAPYACWLQRCLVGCLRFHRSAARTQVIGFLRGGNVSPSPKLPFPRVLLCAPKKSKIVQRYRIFSRRSVRPSARYKKRALDRAVCVHMARYSISDLQC